MQNKIQLITKILLNETNKTIYSKKVITNSSYKTNKRQFTYLKLNIFLLDVCNIEMFVNQELNI